ncbi:MAG: plastocyanin/azurin family copper-binding protein [Dehalococcoidia bacterium]|nr:plastocyanin/azurin family copper-binding protein [Dehalococcoidia bacterium]
MKRIIMRLVLPLVAAIGFIAVAAACGGGGDDKKTGDSSGSGVQEVTVKMTDLVTFQPAEVRVEAGRPVRLTVDNSESAAVHDLTVAEMPVMDVLSSGAAGGMGHAGMDVGAEYDLHIALDGGGVGALEFTPTQSGEYVFICTVPGHEQAGMTGKLIVV